MPYGCSLRRMAELPIAHAGHWLVQVAYFAPVVGFLSWLGITTWKDRRRRRAR